jgi:hypothetical protein
MASRDTRSTDRALVAWARRVGLPSVEGTQIDRFEADATLSDPVCDASEGSGVRGPLPFSRLKISTPIVPFVNVAGMITKVGMST